MNNFEFRQTFAHKLDVHWVRKYTFLVQYKGFYP